MSASSYKKMWDGYRETLGHMTKALHIGFKHARSLGYAGSLDDYRKMIWPDVPESPIENITTPS